MAEPAVLIYEEPDEVERRLAALGLSVHVLHESILDGEAARESCTLHDPPLLAGVFAWGRTVRGLRDRLVPDGWTASDERNYSTVVSPDGERAVAVATGDEGTSVRDGHPCTKHAKGPATVIAVERNRQLELFPNLIELPRLAADDGGPVTWLLLVRRTGSALCAELSRPTSIDENGANILWAERVLLGEISTGTEPTVERRDSGEIDIKIERRTG